MAEVVDSIIAELILKSQGYAEGFDQATAAHGRFQKSVDHLKGQTFDLAAEGQKYKQGLSAISGAEEETTAKVVRTRKARTDAVKKAATDEVSAEQSAANAKKQIAQASAADQERLRTQELTSRRRAALQAIQDARNASAPELQRPTIYDRSDNPNRRTSGTLRPAGDLTRGGSGQGPIPASALAGGAVADQKAINDVLIQRAELQERLKVATDADAVAIRPQLTELNLAVTYERAGLDAKEATLRLDRELLVIETQRAARVKEAADADAKSALIRSSSSQAGDLRARASVASDADKLSIQDQITFITRRNSALREGLTIDEANVRANTELLALQKFRTEQAEKQALLDRSGAGGLAGAGKNAARFAEGAGLGRSFGSGATVAGIATGAVIAGVAELAKQGIEYAQSLKQDSEQLGLTTRDLQIYRAAAQTAGLTTEQLKEGIGQLGDNLGKAQEGSKAQGLIFQRLHIDIGSAATGYKSLSDILPSLSDRLSQITDKTQRQAIEQALGGEQLRKMDPILSQGAAAFDAYGRSIEKAGGILSDSAIQRSAETAKKIALLNDELQRDLASTVSNNAKAIEDLATAFFRLADGALKAFGYLRQVSSLDVINGGLSSRVREGITGQSQSDDKRQAYASLLETDAGRKALLDRNSQQLNALNLADKGGGLSGPGLDDVGDSPQARYAAHQKALAERATILRVQRAYDAKANQGQAPVQPGKPDGNVLAGPDKKGPKGKSPEDLAEAEIERTKQFNDQLASLQEEALRAQESMTGSIEERAADEKKLADAQYEKKIGDINSQLAKQLQQIAKDYPKGGGETFAAEARSRAEILKGAAKIAQSTDQQARDQQTAAEVQHAITAHLQTQLSIDSDLLSSRLALADTSKERLAIELQLLANAKEQERNRLNDQLATLKPGDPARLDVQKNIDSLDARYAGQEAGVRRQNETPGQQYARSLKSTSDTVQDSEVNALKQFNSELDKSVEKTLHLHGILGSIVDDLIDMAIKQALIKPLAGALFGGGTGGGSGLLGGLFGSASKALAGGGGGLLGSIGKFFGLGGAGGAGSAALDGSIDPALFGLAGGGSFEVSGNGGIDRNVLSINGQPQVRVNQGETVAVIPKNIAPNNSRASAATPSVTVLAPRHYDLSNSLIDRDTLAQMNEENRDYARQVATYSGQRAVGEAASQAPGVIRRAQTLKG